MVCTDQFKTFAAKLQPTPKQVDRITSASNTITDKLAERFEISKRKIFLQGSFQRLLRPPGPQRQLSGSAESKTQRSWALTIAELRSERGSIAHFGSRIGPRPRRATCC